MDDRVFYTDDGRLYKGKHKTADTHAEMNFPHKEMLEVLTEEPCTREEMNARINKLEIQE